MLEILIATVCALLISFLIRAWIAAHQWRMERLRFHRDQFFDCADRLLKAQDISDDRLSMVKNMAHDIDSKRSFRVLTAALSEFYRGRTGQKYRASPGPPDCSAAAFHYLLAISYLKGIRGMYLRSKLAPIFDPSAANQAAEIIWRGGLPKGAGPQAA